MGERLSIRRSSGFDRNAMRLWALIITAVGLLGRGVLQNRLLGVAGGSTAQVLEALNIPGAMTAASVSLVMQAVETCAVPIYAVLLLEGFEKTSNVKNYLLRIGALAVLCEIPYNFAIVGKLLDNTSRNPVFALLLALIMLYLYTMFPERSFNHTLIKAAITVAAMLWALMFRVKFGMSMVLIVSVLWGFRARPTMRYFLGASVAVCCCVGDPMFLFAPFGFLLVHLYNGEEGNTNRVLQYLLYPILLILVGFVGEFVF